MTASTSFKVESGIQLLARLSRKPIIENFYPILFQSGPKQGEVIELYSEHKLTSLLTDIVCTALMPVCLKGIESGVLIFSCNGHFNFNTLVSCMQKKIVSADLSSLQSSSGFPTVQTNKLNTDGLLEKALSNLFVMEIYDTTQFYASIYNLENILIEHSNISLVVFDTIGEFYWSEQSHKLMKIDNYIKKILSQIQKITKEHKLTILYTRPEYFSSNKDASDLEPCCEIPTLERINYRIYITYTSHGIYQASIKTHKSVYIQKFHIEDNQIRWI